MSPPAFFPCHPPEIVYNKSRTCRCDGIGRRSGLKIHRWRQRTGSSPVTGTTSSRTAYRSRRRFLFPSKRHRSFTPSLLLSKSKPLRWVSILCAALRAAFLYVSAISLATSFFIPLQSSSRAHSAAPRFQTATACWVAVWGRRCAAVLSVAERISILTAPAKTKGTTKVVPFVLGSAGRWPAPPFGISMLGAGKAAPALLTIPPPSWIIEAVSSVSRKESFSV